ncbi:chromate efflux transporter [Kiloniella laminariae]|uniref:Chromate efflux transporter n=1 Tax=Kiloniella laminariae TaxID=454162 RepID=A0ABT4LP50_9PROT|nr:chromate efflux transporter [Kiloniella laminariae]MCZ4282898.1 chromate efflux transporter [Kiloniella laminariae]
MTDHALDKGRGSSGTVTADKTIHDPITLWAAIRIWFQIGILSFGGPTAQIALMHRVIVDERKWLTETQFLNALSFCMLLPGPEAMQLATYAGWRLHGVAGGLAAGLLFVLPGAFVVLALAAIYAAFGSVPFVEALFFGIKAAVLIIVLEALLRISRKALKKTQHWIIAAVSLVAIFFLALPFPLIVFLAGLYGFWRSRKDQGFPEDLVQIDVKPVATLRTVVLWLTIWLLPLVLLSSYLGEGDILGQIGWFFSKLAVVTFGGAYAVLAYMGQDVVQNHGWLTAGQMMDGLGLAETTPGPLILVTEFVGFLAAYQQAETLSWLAGLSGAMVALWATFAPCFLWIFAGAPYIEWIGSQPRLKGALSAIIAAVVGVILNLSLWFALHVFFAEVTLEKMGPVQLWIPDLGTLDIYAVALAVVSGGLLLRLHWSIPKVLAVSSGLALAISYAPL